MKTKHPVALALLRYVLPVAVLLGLWYIADERQWALSGNAWNGDLARVKLWVALGAKVDAVSEGEFGTGSGQPAFVAAAWGGHDDVIAYFIEHGADINRRGWTGNTALNAAAIRGHLSTVQLLLSHGANPNLVGERSPLENAEERGDAKMIALLKSCGAHH